MLQNKKMNEETSDFLYHLHFNFLLGTQGANVLSLALKTTYVRTCQHVIMLNSQHENCIDKQQ